MVGYLDKFSALLSEMTSQSDIVERQYLQTFWVISARFVPRAGTAESGRSFLKTSISTDTSPQTALLFTLHKQHVHTHSTAPFPVITFISTFVAAQMSDGVSWSQLALPRLLLGRSICFCVYWHSCPLPVLLLICIFFLLIGESSLCIGR